MLPTRILLIRLGALGDIVHALPLAAALRAAFPEARLDWLVEAKHRAVLACVPILSNRIIVDSRKGTGERSPLAVMRKLRAAKYDVAIDAQGLLKSAVYARAAGAARAIGFSRAHLREPAARFFYTETVDVDAVLAACAARRGAGAHTVSPAGAVNAGRAGASQDLGAAREAAADAGLTSGPVTTARRGRALGQGLDASWHIIDRNLALASAVGLEPAAASEWRFPLEAGDSTAAADTRARLGLAPGEPFVLLNPGAAWPNKRWPAERFGALARRIADHAGVRSAVLWGPGETELAQAVVDASDGAALTAPPTRVADVVALAREAALLVSGDTGPIHLAAAAGTPVVGLYGPTDPARNGPWDPRDLCVSRVERCACHHQRRCRVAAWCLGEVTVDEVWRAVQARMGWQ